MVIFTYHLIYVFMCFFLLTTVETSINITLGNSLTAGVNNPSSSWVSPSKDFAFGFQEVQPGNFLLAIWLDSIPEKIITWSANRDHLAPKGSKVQLTSDRGLILTEPSGRELWSVSRSRSLAYGAMLDTGNFVLTTQASNVIWQSFDEPTDTVLPTQVLNLGAQLIARYTATNYSSGRFMLQLGNDGILAFYTTKFPKFKSVNTFYLSFYTLGFVYQVVFNESGSLYLVTKQHSILSELLADRVSEQDFYQMAILEYDGVLRHYVYPKRQSLGSIGWSAKSFTPENICTAVLQQTGSGVCGFNSYCQLGNDNRPYCSCPPDYTLLDPDNPMGGCIQNFEPQSCGKQSDQDLNKFDLKELVHVHWQLSDYEQFHNVTEDWCRNNCLPDCLCVLAIFREGGYCWKKKIPLANGNRDSSYQGKSLVKVRTSADFNEARHRSSRQVWRILAGISGFSNVVLLLVVSLGIYSFVSRKKLKQGSDRSKENYKYSVHCFSYQELSKATNGFKEEIGSGNFGVVYKGIMAGPLGTPIYVAVKELDSILQDPDKELKAEINTLGETHHKNLVQLIGFCDENEHQLLVYEYMSNGTLSDYLYVTPKPSWEKRLKIAQGVAKGLLYLHEDCSNRIIHCDIKPQNILLDDDFNARISDFGLAKLMGLDQTHTNTMARGTRGYVAPEWFKNMPITTKVDVYSYGTLLLEIICCQSNVYGGDCEQGVLLLTDRAIDCYQTGTTDDLVGDDMGALSDKQRLERMVRISLCCIQDDPNLRPTMRKVAQMLEGLAQVPEPPFPTMYSSLITD